MRCGVRGGGTNSPFMTMMMPMYNTLLASSRVDDGVIEQQWVMPMVLAYELSLVSCRNPFFFFDFGASHYSFSLSLSLAWAG
jgi:hypothetical protein